MRYIFLDSNVFFDHWHLRNAEFSLVAAFIKNSRSILLLSEIVCSEVQNLYEREQKTLMAALKKNYEKAQRFNKERAEYSLDVLIQPYNFKDVLKEKIEFVEFIDYNEISHSVVIERAIGQVLPFRVNEKGYRDTMIWLSLLHFLKLKTKDDEVDFITRNTNDFYTTAQTFHFDLEKDIQNNGITCQISLFSSLHACITTKIETNEYEFSNSSISDQYLDQISGDIESEFEWLIDLMSTHEFKKLLDASGTFFPYTSSLLNHRLEIIEGMEDGFVLSYNRISSTTLYISYSFNLRRCALDLTIPAAEYLQHKS